MIYIVIGMHKSGTTLIAECLHKSGVLMHNRGSDDDYDSGFQYERRDIVDLNMRLLRSENKHSLDTIRFASKDDLSSELVDSFKAVLSTQEMNSEWGFKDPRTVLTYHLWQQYMPAHKLIVVYRHPLEVLHHYYKQNNLVKSPIIAWKVLKAWIHYNRAVLELIKNTDRTFIVLNYSKRMNDDGYFARLGQFIKRPIKDCRDKRLCRSVRVNSFWFRFISLIFACFFHKDVYKIYGELEGLS